MGIQTTTGALTCCVWPVVLHTYKRQTRYCQTQVQASALGLGVVFVFALSQEHEEPHQNLPEEGNILQVLNF